MRNARLVPKFCLTFTNN